MSVQATLPTVTELLLTRQDKTPDSTIGELMYNGIHECFILEDRDRGLTKNTPLEQINKIKVFGLTCIPYGRYEVAMTWSNRFGCMMPLLLGVPGWEGVRIHWGNYSKDTEGCLIVGQTKAKDFVGSSKVEYSSLQGKLAIDCVKGKVFITIN